MIGTRGVVVAVVVVAVFASRVTAQSSDAPSPSTATLERGRSLFLEGRDAYEAGDFATALEKFRLSYELTSQPMLLFNLGSAADRLRRDEEALRYYEAYLRELPSAPNRAEVEGRIVQMRATLAERRAADERTQAELNRARDEAERATAEAASLSRPRATAAWVLAGSSAAVAVTGGVLFAVGRADMQSVESAPDGTPWTSVEASFDRAPKLTSSGLALIGLGSAGAIAGITWALVRVRTRDRHVGLEAPATVRIAPLVGPTFGIRGWF